MKKGKKVCPSYSCKPGAKLIGVRQDDGTIAILPKALNVDSDFCEEVKKDELLPEQKFRFAGKCIENGCSQWTGKNCGVIEILIQRVDTDHLSNELPDCSIRSQCRWFAQSGSKACRICPVVITHIDEDEIKKIVN